MQDLIQMKGALATQVRKRIAVLDDELAKLNTFLELCSPNGHGRKGKVKARAKSSGTRIDWNAVRAKLPSKFATADVTAYATRAGAPAVNAYTVINGWVKRNLVRRYLPGKYEKVSQRRVAKVKAKKGKK